MYVHIYIHTCTLSIVNSSFLISPVWHAFLLLLIVMHRFLGREDCLFHGTVLESFLVKSRHADQSGLLVTNKILPICIQFFIALQQITTNSVA